MIKKDLSKLVNVYNSTGEEPDLKKIGRELGIACKGIYVRQEEEECYFEGCDPNIMYRQGEYCLFFFVYGEKEANQEGSGREIHSQLIPIRNIKRLITMSYRSEDIEIRVSFPMDTIS